ncbi:L-threonylcarbamoyladenylate synthase [Alkaliflexus imshenetskii]|uniref:L-threonylcarbamoyladenylate synthase n=1 Tax=Alkaliflexus imshenetskii TaxID=286730 RepID=UPI000479E50F|nr:L-threonylcarbamoyladenylate synthase [Alkaliflexus imshenetskii]
MNDRFDNEDLKQALEVLKQGGIILYPTDTVWGIGCDATNIAAVEKIIELKKRDAGKGMIVITDQPGRIPQYVKAIPELAWDLIELAEKPLTLIYPDGKNLAANVLAHDGSIGIRVTNELFSKTLCTRFKTPIVATSANLSGKKTPRSFIEIEPAIVEQVDYVVKFRQDDSKHYIASGIMRLGLHGEFELIRQ